MSEPVPPTPAGTARRGRLTPVALLAGVAATAALALATTGSLAAFTASITNNADTAASGALTMRETQTIGAVTTTCNSTDATPVGNTINTNAATCSTINKYGGSTTLFPGGPASVSTVVITNTGSVPANTFTLKPQGCTQANATATPNGSAADLCTKINVALTVGTAPGTAVTGGTGTAAALAGTTITLGAPLAPGAALTYNFSVSLDASAGNTYQNLTASQSLLWSFST